jgi:DNA-binding response OmpR family regulator
MTRILMMDTDQALADTVGRQCLKHGIAVRFADNLCDGLRHLLDIPISLVLLEAAHARLSGLDLAKLFDAVIPGVPVVIRLDAEGAMDEQVQYELHGFRVVRYPFDVLELLAKAERSVRVSVPRPSQAAGAVTAACQ